MEFWLAWLLIWVWIGAWVLVGELLGDNLEEERLMLRSIRRQSSWKT